MIVAQSAEMRLLQCCYYLSMWLTYQKLAGILVVRSTERMVATCHLNGNSSGSAEGGCGYTGQFTAPQTSDSQLQQPYRYEVWGEQHNVKTPRGQLPSARMFSTRFSTQAEAAGLQIAKGLGIAVFNCVVGFTLTSSVNTWY